MRHVHILILAATCLATAFPAMAAGPPACAGGVEAAHARIVRVEKNGVLVLSDGRAALLEGIRLASADPGPLGDASLAAVRALAMAQPLTLTAMRPKEDRYDRIRVQAFGKAWLQTELLQRGLARVDISPGRGECAHALYEAEGAARAAGRGLWALSAFVVRKPQMVTMADIGSFQLVEGKLVNVASHDGRVFLDFSDDYGHGFSATIAPEDHKAFRSLDPPILNLAGHMIRVRGIVQDYGGRPEIAISNPAQIELLN